MYVSTFVHVLYMYYIYMYGYHGQYIYMYVSTFVHVYYTCTTYICMDIMVTIHVHVCKYICTCM